MTKEKEETIETLYKDLELAKKEDSIDIDVLTVNLETILSMLKEKDKEIESLEKTLDKRFIYVTGARTVYGRLMELDKESIIQDDLKRRNELNQCIKAEEEYKKLYHKALSDLVKADKENIKKDKQIDLMAEYLDGDDTSLANYLYKKNGKCNKEMIKQYIERKVEKE